MKRVVSYLIIVLVMLGLVEVNASNYEMMELIPLDVETTIRGDNFLYKDWMERSSNTNNENKEENSQKKENDKENVINNDENDEMDVDI